MINKNSTPSPKPSNTFLFFVLLVIICAIIPFLYRSLLFKEGVQNPNYSNSSEINQSIFAFKPFTSTGIGGKTHWLYYANKPENIDTTDIVRCEFKPDSQVVENLTNSPDYSESSPVLSPKFDQLAFFAVSQKGDRSLRVLDIGINTGGPRDITANKGQSRLGNQCQISLQNLPKWSPNGKWIGFLAECKWKKETVELFVAPIGGSGVREIGITDDKIDSFYWYGEEQIVYFKERNSRAGEIYQGFINTSSLSVIEVK